MPFINALGYNVFDPSEVMPELVADVGVKKGEKVDYAIMRAGQPIILVECKWCGFDLDSCHASQLFRYFTVTPARIGILTNGVQYRFYSDLEQPNKMDNKPFLEFSMLDVDEKLADQLKRFTRDGYDLDQVISTASDLKYRAGIKKVLDEEWANPSDDMVRMLASRVYSGRMTQLVREQFGALTKLAMNEFVSEKVSERLRTALRHETGDNAAPDREEAAPAGPAPVQPEPDQSKVTTTEAEKEGHYIIKAIVGSVTDPRRVAMRDAQSYCAILLDDNNRKPICRLWFNSAQMRISVFDKDRVESKIAINDLHDLYAHADTLRATVISYDEGSRSPMPAGGPSAQA